MIDMLKLENKLYSKNVFRILFCINYRKNFKILDFKTKGKITNVEMNEKKKIKSSSFLLFNLFIYSTIK